MMVRHQLSCAALILASLVGTTARASITLDARADYQAVDPNAAATTLGLGEDNAVFRIYRMRVDMKGNLSETIAYRTRLKADNASSADVAATDSGQNKFIDFAYLTHTMGEMIVTGGKIIAPIGGFESAKNPGEYYFLSKAGTETSPLLWQLGAMASYSANGQRLDVFSTNTSAIEAVGTNGAQTKTAFGGGWKGSFGEGGWMNFLAQYMAEPSVGTSNGKQYYALGTKLGYEAFDFEFDWLQNLYMKSAYTVGAVADTIETRSAVASLKYAPSKDFAAILKHENSENVLASTAGGDRNPVQYWTTSLALEYKPLETDKFRYHIAYNHQDASRDAQVQTMIVGFRYLGEVVP
ncbi:MAG: hypothetical protein IPJ84_09525 [Bdellovibrionales bacterium]|nr:hypothetical protein [Bdellovibrionales bacterium]